MSSSHSLSTEPSSNQAAKSFISLGSNKESIIVGSVGVLVLLFIIILVIFVSIFKCRDQKISASSVYDRYRGAMSYRQLLRDSDVHQTSTSERREWITTHYRPATVGPCGVLVDCPPPPYHTVVTLTQPVDSAECNASNNGTVHNFTDSEAPPPYPGSYM